MSTYKKITSFILSLIIVLPILSGFYSIDAKAYTPPVENVKIGIYYGSDTLSSANLENASGRGEGYEFGYLDDRRAFVPLGASTQEKEISFLVDKNMYYDSSSNTYKSGDSGDVVVGCYHIQLSTAYETYEEARAAADTFTSVNAFPKCYYGTYYVCAGDYTSAVEAQEAASGLSIQQNYTITSGTAGTITVVVTGTDKILLEFDWGNTNYLAANPIGHDDPITWFKGTQYYGAFQYRRLDDGDLTVINVVDIEDYIKCSIPYEMVPSWPIEALKAQAVSARTYLMTNLNKHSSYGFDLCDYAHCQMYSGITRCTDNTDRAVEETAGQYLTYNGALCTTYYSSSTGGATESAQNVWTVNLPYLVGKVDPYEAYIADDIPGYYWTKQYTGAELTKLLKNKGYSNSNIVNLEVSEFTPSGNVLKVTFTDDRGKTYSFSKNNSKSVFGLKSQHFNITNNSSSSKANIYVDGSSAYITDGLNGKYAIGAGGTVSAMGSSGTIYAITSDGVSAVNTKPSGNVVNSQSTVYTISGAGNGHNVGLSQYGAYSMAKCFDMDYVDILTFYYTGTEILIAE